MMHYPPSNTALLFVDPLNDFMSVLGKGWPLVRTVAKQVKLHQNLAVLSDTFRILDWPIFYAPHHQYKAGSFAARKYLHPSQALQKLSYMFNANGFGGQFYSSLAPQPNDTVASEHSCSSGFMGTDLHEKLQDKNISHLIIAGFLTNTCIESTARSAIDLDYHVTLLTDGAAAWTPQDQSAATELNFPLIAHHLSDTSSLIKNLESKYV